jgi:integrase/recombinase XerD
VPDYIEAAGITDDADGYLFRTARRKTGQLTTNPLFQQDAHRIIRRRAKAAGIETRIGNHAFRATGITAYLKNSGKLEVAGSWPSWSVGLTLSPWIFPILHFRQADWP